MTIRAKIWLIAVSVAMTVFVASWVRLYLTQSRIIKDAQTSADELAHDIAEDLRSLDADADDRDLEEKLLGYLNRHARIARLDLVVYREDSNPASRIVAPRGDRPEITRFAPLLRQPLGFTRASTGSVQEDIVLPVDLKGPWRATLTLKWTLGPVEALLKTEKSVSLISAVVLLVVLTLLSALLTSRIIGRPLEALALAMRDVEAGDLNRRLPAQGNDEFGRLSQGFNRMLGRLSSADAAIRAFNQRLAQEIEAATRDLYEKNVTLNHMNRLLNDLRRDNASRVRLATLGQLAAQLAHEIGTPLSSVSGHLQLAMMQRDLRPALRERLEVASREIERISRIVRDYLDSTRPLDPERKPVDLRRLLREVVEVTSPESTPGARPEVRLEMEEAEGPFAGFVTDAGLLRQIILNLMSNALDAVGPKGRVTLSARAQGNDLWLTVADTGHGISPEDLRRIFEPFYTTKGRGKGTGLGLAICRQLTTALGGSISVESEPGKGSAFTLRLPLHGPPTGPTPVALLGTTESQPRAIGGGGTS